jgi:hypothetical protein
MISKRMLQVLALGGVLAAGAVASGCAADGYPPTVGGYTTVYASQVPPDMAAYPRVAYGGNYAYLVGDSWYYPSGNRWVILQQEPPQLYRYRTSYYVPSAPPAYRAVPVRGAYPVPRQYAPPVQYGYPPPAVRVR